MLKLKKPFTFCPRSEHTSCRRSPTLYQPFWRELRLEADIFCVRAFTVAPAASAGAATTSDDAVNPAAIAAMPTVRGVQSGWSFDPPYSWCPAYCRMYQIGPLFCYVGWSGWRLFGSSADRTSCKRTRMGIRIRWHREYYSLRRILAVPWRQLTVLPRGNG